MRLWRSSAVSAGSPLGRCGRIRNETNEDPAVGSHLFARIMDRHRANDNSKTVYARLSAGPGRSLCPPPSSSAGSVFRRWMARIRLRCYLGSAVGTSSHSGPPSQVRRWRLRTYSALPYPFTGEPSPARPRVRRVSFEMRRFSTSTRPHARCQRPLVSHSPRPRSKPVSLRLHLFSSAPLEAVLLVVAKR